MTTYKEIFGKYVQVLASDPTAAVSEGQIWYNSTTGTFKSSVSVNAWSSGGNLNTARPKSGAGTQTAALAFGGYITGVVDNSEEYNGSSWAEGNNLNTARQKLAGAGTQTAGLGCGGYVPGSGAIDSSEEYNGTSWTEGNNLNTARAASAMAGAQTAAAMFVVDILHQV